MSNNIYPTATTSTDPHIFIDIPPDENNQNQVANIWSRLCTCSATNKEQIKAKEWSGLDVKKTLKQRVIDEVNKSPWSFSLAISFIIAFSSMVSLIFHVNYNHSYEVLGSILGIFLASALLIRGAIYCIANYNPRKFSTIYKNLEEYSIKNLAKAHELITDNSAVTLQTIANNDNENDDEKFIDPVILQEQIYSFATIVTTFIKNQKLPHNRQPFNIKEIKRVNIESPLIKAALQEQQENATSAV